MGEKKARGRRNLNKKKIQDDGLTFDDIPDLELIDNANSNVSIEDQNQLLRDDSKVAPAFFGLMDSTELEYFKQAESTLAADIFSSPEERAGFIHGVFEEAKHKEMKLATNQSCSQLLERLITVGNSLQLHELFRSFSGNYLALAKHKYSSHCLEALFSKSAGLIESEMALSNPLDLYKTTREEENNDNHDYTDEPQITMENLFLFMVEELRKELNDLPKHPYGSHVLRTVLSVLSGSPISPNIIRSKKSRTMRKIVDMMSPGNDDGPLGKQSSSSSYQTPDAFTECLGKLIHDMTANLDSTSARELAIDKLSSPVITTIISIQLRANIKKPKSPLLDLIFISPAISMNKDPTEESFVEYLLSDSVGSHFFESTIAVMPIKTMERLYNLYMKSRVDKLCRRESGNFVIQAVLKRLKPDQGRQVLDQLIGDIDILLSSNIPMVRAIVETATILNYRIQDISNIFTAKYKVSVHKTSNDFLENVLQLDNSTLGNTKDDWPTAEEMNRALLVQVLVRATPKFLNYVSQGLIDLPTKRLVDFAKHSVFSHVLDACLVPQADITLRRKLLNKLIQSDLLADLACNAYASHSIDHLWDYTYKLKFLRERVAEVLVKNAEQIKSSRYGIRVWGNWKLEKYIRKRYEWWILVKQQEDAIAENLGESRDKKVARTQQRHEMTNKFKGSGIKSWKSTDKTLGHGNLHKKKPYERSILN